MAPMKKTRLTTNPKFRLIRKELVKLYGEDTTKQITARAERHYADCELLCRTASRGERRHLDSTILPAVALYKALLEMDPGNALESAHGIMIDLCELAGAAAGRLLMLPGMKSAFMWLLPKVAVSLFGQRCGFQYENYTVGKGLLRMDMTACPYCRYAEKFGCPELMPVFCDSDFATYGKLPGIRFQRTQTLGTGGKCCDFRFSRE